MAVEPVQDSRTINESIINYKERSSKENVKNMKKAAVLVCFFRKNNEYYFPLIKRPMHERNHPGQIALPGGSMEKNEALMTTALREAFEEIGLVLSSSDLIKIGTRKHQVRHANGIQDNEIHHVFIAKLKVPVDQLNLQEEEVAGLQLFDLEILTNTGNLENVLLPQFHDYYRQVYNAIRNSC